MNWYFAAPGVIALFVSIVFHFVESHHQSKLLKKWDAKKKKWVYVVWGLASFRINEKNNPSPEFKREFFALKEKYKWPSRLGVFGFFLLIIAAA